MERHAHPCPPPYAPDGDDAAVWWDEWDYRFRDTLPVSVAVYVYAPGGPAEADLVVRLIAPDFPDLREGLIFVPGLAAAAVDGRVVRLEAAPYVEEGRTWVPRDALLRLLGASPESLVGRVPTREREGVPYVPLRDAARSLGLPVGWNPEYRAAVVR